MRVPFLGAIPLDPGIAEASDCGQAFVRSFAGSATAAAMQTIIEPIAALATNPPSDSPEAGFNPRPAN
jgi:hypothetical protein